MEFRKLISFGKSSYVVSLPKVWVNKHHLKKGDVLNIEQKQECIIIQPKLPADFNEDSKKKFIEVDGREDIEIKRELIPAYINGYKTIVFIGREARKRSPVIAKMLHSLMALEIIEQSSEKVIARDFLDMKELSVTRLIRKIDVTTKAMLQDSKKTFHESLVVSITERDVDVNRLSNIGFRTLKFTIRNPSWALKTYGIDTIEVTNLWMVISNLEKVADESKRLARLFAKIEKDENFIEQINLLYVELEDQYKEFMKSYYQSDHILALTASKKKRPIIDKLEKLQGEYYQMRYACEALERMKVMCSKIHNIGRPVLEKDEEN